MSAFYSEGVGQGGFIADFTTAGNVVIESFSKDIPASHVIDQPDQFGGPLKWAAVAGFVTATALAQLPFDAVHGLTEIGQGDQFTAPDDHGGGTYVVVTVGETFQIGDYFKANLGLKLRYN